MKRKSTKLLDYRELILSKLIINLVRDKEDFRISCNDTKMGRFGDIIISERDSKDHVIGIHLSDLDRRKKITQKTLCKTSGPFSILEHHCEYKKLENPLIMVLYTNRQVSKKLESVSLKYNGKNVKLRIMEEKKFRLYKKDNANVYKLAMDKDSEETLDQEFLDYFFLYSSSTTGKELETEFRYDFKEIFKSGDEPVDKFIEFMRGWQSTDDYNDNDFFASTIGDYLLIPIIAKQHVKSDKEETVKSVSKDELTIQRYKCLWKAFEQFTFTQVYGSPDLICTEIQNARDANESVINIIDLSGDNWKQWTKLMEICPNINNKKFILFGEKQVNFPQEADVWKNLNDLLRKDSTLYAMLIKDLKFFFFGKEFPLAETDEITKLFTPTHLIRMIEGCFKIGEGTLEKQETIERKFEPTCIDFELLREVHQGKIDNTMILVICNNMQQFKQKICGVEVHHISEYNSKCSIHICDEKNPQHEFDKLSQKNKSRICHLLQFHASTENLTWIKSTKSVQDLQSHRLNKNSHVIDEEALFANHQKLHILRGIAGEGRKTFLRRLITKYNTPCWILRINFEHYVDLFQKNDDIDMFLKHTVWRTYGVTEKSILEVFDFCLKHKRVILLWEFFIEGPYEVKNKEAVVQSMEQFNNRGIEQWILTPGFLQNEMEKRFNVLAERFHPLTESQITQVISFYNKEKAIHDEIIKYVDSAPQIVKQLFGESILILLHASWKKKDNQPQPTLPDLYDNHLRSRGPSDSEIGDNQMRNYEKAAMKCIFKDRFPVEIDSFITHIAINKDKNHIIHKVTLGNIPVFEHVTITEYLVACYFTRNCDKIQNWDFLYEPQYRRIRYLFDLKQPGNSAAHLAVLCQDKAQLQESGVVLNMKNSMNKTPLELAATWGKFHPDVKIQDHILTAEECEDVDESVQIDIVKTILEGLNQHDMIGEVLNLAEKSKSLSTIDAILGSRPQKYNFTTIHIHTVLYHSLRYGYTNILQNLEEIPRVEEIKMENGDSLWHLAAFYGNQVFFQKFGNSDIVNQHGEAPFHIAARRGHIQVVEFFLSSTGGINNRCSKLRTALSYASEYGQKEIVKILILSESLIDAQDIYSKTPLSYACERGHLEIVQLLINSKANPESRDKTGETCFYKAAKNNHLEVVKYLTQDCKVNIYSPNSDNATPLHAASQEGHCGIVKYLINCKADVNAKSKSDTTPICMACKNGHLEVIKLLLNHGASCNDVDKDGHDCLWLAASGGHLQVVEYLIDEQKVAMDNLDNDGCSSLWISAQKGHLKILKFLSEKGGDAGRKNKVGVTPFICACQSGHLDIVEFLVELKANSQSDGDGLWSAAAEGHFHIVQFFKKQGANFSKTNNRLLPLHAASQNGHLEIVKLLIDDCQDVNVQTVESKTPLHLASQHGHLAVVKFLISRQKQCNQNANINSIDKNGSTSLYLASLHGHLDVVKFLHDHGANLNTATCDLCSPICAAASNGYLEIVKFLAEKRAFINRRDCDRLTPIQWAAKRGHLDIVEYLAGQKVNIDFADVMGRTPLWEAAYNNHLGIVTFLVKHGAYINSRTKNGITPLHAAIRKGNLEIVKFLIDNKAGTEIRDIHGCGISCTAILFAHNDILEHLKKRKINICNNHRYIAFSLYETRLMLNDGELQEFY